MLLYDLTELTPELTPQVGGKAAALGALARAGLPVPRGVVLTTGACGRADLVAPLLDQVCDRVGAGLFAVRSSATAEDLAGASSAGQYESVLDVGRAGLLPAIEACWASLVSERVRQYRRNRGIPDEGLAMAVIIQAMVPAVVSGVLFTAHPVTGRRDQMVVEAVPGPGERLVSGREAPDHWELQHGAVLLEYAPRRLLSASQLRTLAALAERVEALRGAPQDVEWALAGGEFFVLQARPITTLPT